MPTPEQATAAVTRLMTSVPALDPQHLHFQEVPGAFAMVTGVPFPTLNGVWAYGQADPAQIRDLLHGLPVDGSGFCLQARDQGLAPVAEELGMASGPDVPLMTMDGPPAEIPVDGLRIRELAPADFDARTQVTAAGFEVPDGAIRCATALFGRLRGYRMYIGEVAGTTVTTAVSITQGDAVGIFDVATPAEHRGRGFGAAITAHAVRDAMQDGARWAWLQSSPEGFGVYERLGFRTVERWSLWLGGL